MMGVIMIKRMKEFLSSWPMTLVSGIFLVASFVLPRLDVVLPVDPAWATVIISGLPLLYGAIRKLIFNKGISKISSALLITIAMVAAICIDDLFAAGEVAFIMAIGELLEDVTTDRAKRGLRRLVDLAPTQARRVRDGKEETVSAAEICEGDVIRILPGEVIAVDGEILFGETTIDQSVMTGESLPVDKSVGDEVFCGTINRFGAIDVKATRAWEDSSLQKIIRLMEDAEENQAPTQRIADRWASFLVPAALLVAIIGGIVTQNIVVAVTVLVVFCPCALVLATPTAIMAAIGQATGHGVIIKSGEALEKMGRVDTVAFDKTGTLTEGALKVSDVLPLDESISQEELLSTVASAESFSEHPLGRAIAEHAEKNGVLILSPTSFRAESGKGVVARVADKNILCGNQLFLAENGIATDEKAEREQARLRAEGKAVIYAVCDGKLIGMVALSDTLRKESGEVVRALGEMDTKTVLLTGDDARTANYFASMAGIDEVHASLLPQHKVEKIAQIEEQGRKVCMIGDGVNDAPALKTASVGVAMGGMGSDITVDAADIVLMSDDISRLPYLKWLSREAVRTIKLGITLSMVINFVAVLLSLLQVLTPTTGALVHNAGSVIVVLIAALLYDRKYKKRRK